LKGARECFETALDRAESEDEDDEHYYKQIKITVRYNLARINEALCQHDKSETLHNDFLKNCPNYIDCYLRLGWIARVRGQISGPANE
jgi:RNA polymerase-associated protein CTR9